MKISKNHKRLCAVLGLSLVCGTSMVSAATGSKMVEANYRNIVVTYNGTQKPMSIEPFTINGSTYVPLRAVGDILGVQTTWIPTTNTVAITGNTPQQSIDGAILQAYQTQIQNLNARLQAAEAELALYKNASNNNSNNGNSSSDKLPITAAALNETANYLYSNYSDGLGSSIDLDFELTQKASKLQLVMSYSTSTEDARYMNLSQNKVEDFIYDVCEEIVARHGEVAIEGGISYLRDDFEKVSFSVSAAGKYTYDFCINEDDVRDIVDDYFGNSISLGTLGKQSIDSIEAEIKGSKISFSVYLDATSSELLSSTDDTKNWNEIAKTSLVRFVLEDTFDEIESESNGDFAITGSIYTNDNREMASIDSDYDIEVYDI